MPIIRNTEIRFHRPELLKPIFKKPKDRAPPEDAGAGTSADAARSQQQARNWRYYFLKTVAIAPVASATGASPTASNFDQNSDSSSWAAGNRGTDNSANNPGFIVTEQENCRTIDKLRAGASAENIEHILKKGLERLDLLFTPQNLPGKRKESEVAIDFYLENNFHKPIPPIVRDLMIVFDMAIRDVHRAFPYGRGNVLVRNRDALAGNAGKNPNGINVSESSSKNGLTELGRHLGLASEPNSASTQTDQIQVGLQLAASQLLLGSTSCSGYVDALAAASMARLSQIRLPDGGTLQLKVIGHGDGPIRLDDV